jgi:5'(3')-deoxyribonucleotidase
MKDFLDYFKEDSNKRPTIYCDMDGVLVDLIGGMSKILNIPNLSQKNFDSIINPIKPKIDEDHPDLFAKLPWMPDGKTLWKYISKYKVEILSAHTTTWQPKSKSGKIKWIENNLRPKPHFSNIVLRTQKKDYAKTDGVPNILIDDWSKNIKEWQSAGGIAIQHKSANQTILELKKLGL